MKEGTGVKGKGARMREEAKQELWERAWAGDEKRTRELAREIGAEGLRGEEVRGGGGSHPADAAAGQGREGCLRILIEEGWSPIDSGSDDDGNTAGHYAAAGGSAGCLRTLIGAGWDLGAKNRYGLAAGHLALKKGNLEALKALLEAGWEPGRANGEPAVFLAIQRDAGDGACLRELLERGASLEETERLVGGSAGHMAAGAGKAGALRILLEAGWDFGMRDARGETAEEFARKKGQEACAEMLRAWGGRSRMGEAVGEEPKARGSARKL